MLIEGIKKYPNGIIENPTVWIKTKGQEFVKDGDGKVYIVDNLEPKRPLSRYGIKKEVDLNHPVNDVERAGISLISYYQWRRDSDLAKSSNELPAESGKLEG